MARALCNDQYLNLRLRQQTWTGQGRFEPAPKFAPKEQDVQFYLAQCPSDPHTHSQIHLLFFFLPLLLAVSRCHFRLPLLVAVLPAKTIHAILPPDSVISEQKKQKKIIPLGSLATRGIVNSEKPLSNNLVIPLTAFRRKELCPGFEPLNAGEWTIGISATVFT